MEDKQEKVEVEEKPKFQLSSEHQMIAKQILEKNITKRYRKKGCKICNLAGFKGFNKEGLLIPCNCVNVPPAREEWGAYCMKHPELKAHFFPDGNPKIII